MLKKCTKKCAAREKFFFCRYSCVAVSHNTILFFVRVSILTRALILALAKSIYYIPCL